MTEEINIIDYLSEQLKSREEYNETLELLVQKFISGAYLNLYSSDYDAKQLAKQLAWAGWQTFSKTVWDMIRNLIPEFLDSEGNAINTSL